MSSGEIDKLMDKYANGESDLQAEEKLRLNAEKVSQEFHPWFAYIQKHKKKAPPQLKDRIWQNIQHKKNKQRKLAAWFAVAASFLLILTISIAKTRTDKMSYDEKERVLNEALQMFSNTEEPKFTSQQIIYEDELVVIYTQHTNRTQ